MSERWLEDSERRKSSGRDKADERLVVLNESFHCTIH